MNTDKHGCDQSINSRELTAPGGGGIVMLSWLYTLVLMIVVALSSWFMFGSASIFVCTIIFGFALAFAVRWWMGLLIFVACLVLLVYLLLPSVETARGFSCRMQCTNNLKRIVLALHNYHLAYGCFPPARVKDKNGKPMHSWRVLILPFMECQDLYEQYYFNEPWDGPHNQKLLEKRPGLYVCPCDKKANEKGTTYTSYAAVVGSDGAWNNDQSCRFDDAKLAGKASSTIMVAETANAGVQWTEPKDISLDTLQSGKISPDAATISSKHGCYRRDFWYDYEYDMPSSVNVALVDGSVRSIPSSLLVTKTLIKLLKIGGFSEEEIDSAPYLREQPFKASLRWQNCVALTVWIIAVVLLLGHAARCRKLRSPEGE